MSAKINRDHADETSPIGDTIEKVIGSLAITSAPVVIVGVNRKVNIGNFENIDVYTGLALPIPGASVADMDELRMAIEHVADEGIKIASAETYKRYLAIKELATGQA